MILYNKSLKNFQKNYIGYSVLIVISQSCLGSAAAMCILKNGISFVQVFQLGIIVSICMLVNVVILSQQTPKFIFNTGLLSIILSALTIALNVLVI